MNKFIILALLAIPLFSTLQLKEKKSLLRSPASAVEAKVIVDKNGLKGQIPHSADLTEDEKKQAKLLAEEVVDEFIQEQKREEMVKMATKEAEEIANKEKERLKKTETQKSEKENCDLVEQNKALTEQVQQLQNQQAQILQMFTEQNQLLTQQIQLLQEQVKYQQTYTYHQPSQYPVIQYSAFQYLPEQTFGNWLQKPAPQTEQNSWVLAPQFQLLQTDFFQPMSLNPGTFGQQFSSLNSFVQI